MYMYVMQAKFFGVFPGCVSQPVMTAYLSKGEGGGGGGWSAFSEIGGSLSSVPDLGGSQRQEKPA